MNYKQYLEAGYPIASGVMEGACRNVVVDRMECSGMRWIMKGAQSMLNIRCIHLNGDWDRFVNFYIKEEQSNLYPIKAANDELFVESMVASRSSRFFAFMEFISCPFLPSRHPRYC